MCLRVYKNKILIAVFFILAFLVLWLLKPDLAKSDRLSGQRTKILIGWNNCGDRSRSLNLKYQAYISLPLGLEIGRPNSLAVSIHS